MWTAWFGGDGIEHKSWLQTEPSAVTQRGPAQVREFGFPLAIDSAQTPTFLSMTLTGVTFNGRAPVVIATLVRPDGGEIRLANLAVPGPRAGETAPYRRYYDSPERVLLTQQETAAQSLGQWFGQQYPGLAYPADLNDRLDVALFGQPAADGSGQTRGRPGRLRAQRPGAGRRPGRRGCAG